MLAEDLTVNRLEDSVLLWKSICSNKLLASTNVVLFLNKTDILRAKLQSGIRFADHLVSYGDRPNDYENTSKCASHFLYTVKFFLGLFHPARSITDIRYSVDWIWNMVSAGCRVVYYHALIILLMFSPYHRPPEEVCANTSREEPTKATVFLSFDHCYCMLLPLVVALVCLLMTD